VVQGERDRWFKERGTSGLRREGTSGSRREGTSGSRREGTSGSRRERRQVVQEYTINK
jgi:hypothetical protein